MTDPNLPLSTDPAAICHIDTETKALPHTASTSNENVTTAGGYRYAENSFVTIITYGIGDNPVKEVSVPNFKPGTRLDFNTLPEDLKAFWLRAATQKDCWFAAWNMNFDRLQLSNIPNAPRVTPEMTIDVMAQAVASNLPAKLEGASRAIGRQGKQNDGKALIGLFAKATGATPQSHPVEWARFKSYAIQDTEELRHVFKATRPLPRREWEEYWVSERINDRGMMVDVHFCERAAAIAELNERRINRDLKELTGGAIATVGQTARIGQWLYDRLPSAEARDLLVKQWADEDTITGPDQDLVATKLSVSSDRLDALHAWFIKRDEENGLSDEEYDMLLILEARMYGASATPKKFGKMVDQHAGGRLRGQYVFNGAAQTGRYSSRGVQVHNLMRASLKKREAEIIDMISDLAI